MGTGWGDSDGRLRLVDAETGKIQWQAFLCKWVGCVTMSADGRFVTSVGGFHRRYWALWDVATPRVARMEGARHDGKAPCRCTMFHGWDLRYHRDCPVQAHKGRISALAFSACGQKLASGGEDGAVILWDDRKGGRRRAGTWCLETRLSFVLGGRGAAGERE